MHCLHEATFVIKLGLTSVCAQSHPHHHVAQVPRLLKRLRILEFTLDHEAPYFSNMRRRTSRRDSDLNGVVDVRYTGGARMLLLLEVGSRHFKVKVSRGQHCVSLLMYSVHETSGCVGCGPVVMIPAGVMRVWKWGATAVCHAPRACKQAVASHQ